MRDDVCAGVVSFQGGVEEHLLACEKLGVPCKRILSPQDMEGITHLIIPGGESTVIGRFFRETGLDKVLLKRSKEKKIKVWGTCAGAIILGREVSPYSLGLIDVGLERNAYGRQIASFHAEIKVPIFKKNISAVFIRAPKITRVGKSVKVLASHDGVPVLCQNEGGILISTFHPELTDSVSIHEYFLFRFENRY